MSKSRLVAIAVAVVIVPACSQNGSGGNVHAPSQLAPALGAVCDLIMRCPDDLPPLASRSRDECIDIAYWALTCRYSSTGPMRTELPLDATQSQACATALAALSCDQFRTCTTDGSCPDVSACMSLFGGLGGTSSSSGDVAARGEQCHRYGTPQCGDADYCAPEVYDPDRGVMLCEVCAPRLTSGARCDPSYTTHPQCATGLTCLYDTMTGMGSCGTIRADGESCGQNTDCASGFCANAMTCMHGGHMGDACTVDTDCRYTESLRCVMGTCNPPRMAGEACGDDSDCIGGTCATTDHLCGLPDGERCNGSGDCRTGYCPSFTVCTPRVAVGASCSYDDMCQSNRCDTSTGTCMTAPPPVDVGGACTSTSDCAMGLQCDTTCYRPCGACPSGTQCIYSGGHSQCLPPLANGASCEGDTDCMSGFCSDGGSCATRPRIGDPCSGSGTDCGLTAYCNGGTCAARLGPDQACTGYDSCLQPFVCMSGRCQLISLSCDPAPAGQQCTYLRFCDANSYCDLSTFTCAPRVGAGAMCSSSPFGGDTCAPGLTCVSGASGSTCMARVALGASCTATSVCVEGAQCIGGTCTTSAGGNECHSMSECAAGTYCDEHSDTCEPYRQLGDMCHDMYYDVCDPSLYCPFGTFTCTARPTIGMSCDRDSWCGTGATCSDFTGGMCVARVGAGMACETSFEDPWGSNCLESLYCDDTTGTPSCVARKANGEHCSSGQECTSNICDSGASLCVATAECVLPSAH